MIPGSETAIRAPASDRHVALVDARGELAALLERQGFEPRTLASLAELAEAKLSPALVVLRDQRPLARVVGAEMSGLRAALPDALVLVVCEQLAAGELRAALAAGISGVVLEQELVSALVPCLWAVLGGQVCVPRRDSPQIEPASLSAREKQILGLVVMGYMNSQIAAQLFVAESTVKSHLSSAFGKLGVRSRNEAVELILDPGRGLGTGILSLGCEPIALESAAPVVAK